jgi:HAD superfamily hydrolase (TIGR01509 family)
MTPPRAAVFDLGKVLLDFDYSRALERLATDSESDLDSLRAMLFTAPLLEHYESGRMGSEAFYESLRRQAGVRLTYAAFRSAFADIFVPIQSMIEAHAAVRRQGTPTYILSNTNEIAIAHIREQYPFFNQFQGYVLSYEVGALKPVAAIYATLERLANCAPRDLFYLDDRPENVEAAQARGWRAAIVADPESGLRALRDCGLLR